MQKINIIGSGFAGLSAACYLAKEGHEVHIIEQHDRPGGRARKFEAEGFVFDMGPSWYWMPDVFESFFSDFGKSVSDYYQLERLDPSYEIIYKKQGSIEVPADMTSLLQLFEKIEPGSGEKLKVFLKEAKYKYEVGMGDFVRKPSHSVAEYFDIRILKSVFKLQMFSSISSQIRKLFKDERLIKMLEFPVLFLGAKPEDTPAMYSLMNYADLSLGTWYPMGGMHRVISGMTQLAEELGVEFHFNTKVAGINVENGVSQSLSTENGELDTDYVLATGDYHHIEQHLLKPSYRMYSEGYWDKRTMAPSCLIFYIGLDKKIIGLHHHTLFFDESFDRHGDQIYKDPKWPDRPLFYICAPSVTDDSVAPEGCENLFILMPLAVDLEDSEQERERCFHIICDRILDKLGHDIRQHILYKRSYCINDFKDDYGAFKGNAYGLANTLRQTAFLKPKMKNTKVKNLFFAGQLTTPGPGVPPSIISGQVAATEIIKSINNN